MKKVLLFAILGFSISCLGQINSNLRNELLAIYKSDQGRPISLDDKDFLKKLEKQNFIDSINLIRVSKIMDSIGYPGRSLVGDTAYLAAFYVIQHSGIKSQEYYLPIIKKAADLNEIEWRYVAMMIDRIKVGKNEKQIYGTQLHGIIDPKTGYITDKAEFYPIEDESNVNLMRQKVGLSTIEEYAEQKGITYEKKNKSGL